MFIYPETKVFVSMGKSDGVCSYLELKISLRESFAFLPQNRAMRFFLNVSMSVPIAALQGEMGWVPNT